MFLAEIGTAGVISAYFFRHFTFGYSLNVSDPIEGQPVQLSDYLLVFGCGLVFWLLVLLRAKLHGSGDRQADIRKVAKLAKLITPITTLNLCGSLLAPKLPSLVRLLVLFQVSSNLPLLLIWAFLSLEHTRQEAVRASLMNRLQSLKHEVVMQKLLASTLSLEKGLLPPKGIRKSHATLQSSRFERAEEGSVARNKATRVAVHNVDGVGGKVDEAGGNGSGHGSGTSGSGENSGGYGGHGRDGRGTGSGHGRGASGSGNNSGGSEGHGQDERGTGSGHGSRAVGSGENSGGSEGGDGVGGDPEGGGSGTNREQAFNSSKITEMSLLLAAQTTAVLIGFHLMTPSSSSKALLVVVLIDLLVAYLCGLTSILLSSNKPAAEIFAKIGFVCTVLGYILMVAMFIPWYLVLIAVLLFGVVWLIFFWNGLITCATKVWNYLKNSATKVWNYLKNKNNNSNSNSLEV